MSWIQNLIKSHTAMKEIADELVVVGLDEDQSK